MDRRKRQQIESYVGGYKSCVRNVCPLTYQRARKATSLLKAYRILKKLGDKRDLARAIVKPRECMTEAERERTAVGFIPRVGGLGPTKSRVEGSRIVPEFSPGAEKPKPRRRRKRVPTPPKSYIGRVMDDGSYEYGADHQPKDEPITE